ncbi:MAG: hypothetical protein ACYC2Y_09175 [Armatimonadota bacterium]
MYEPTESSFPRWAIALIVLLLLGVAFVALSINIAANQRQSAARSQPPVAVQPTAPAAPATPQAGTPAPTAPAQPAPQVSVPPPPAAPTPPAGLPQSISFEGKNWKFVGGPVSLDVVTTGEHTDGYVIYRKVGDEPPYTALYVELVENSGEFYKYLPATTSETSAY